MRDQPPVRGDDGADAGGGGDHDRPVGLDRADACHRQLLERLAALAVHLEGGVVGLHGQQVRARVDLGGHQAIEADLVADDVPEPDLPGAENHPAVARREVLRLQVHQ